MRETNSKATKSVEKKNKNKQNFQRHIQTHHVDKSPYVKKLVTSMQRIIDKRPWTTKTLENVTLTDLESNLLPSRSVPV